MLLWLSQGSLRARVTPQQAEAGGSPVVPLSGGERPGLTRETEMPTEQSQASRIFPPPWTQIPGTGRVGVGVGQPAGQGRGTQTPLPGFTFAQEPPRIWHQAGSRWAAPRRITYSLSHHFPTACCVPGLEPEVKDTLGQGSPRLGASWRHSVCQNTAAKSRELGVHKHRGRGLGTVCR